MIILVDGTDGCGKTTAIRAYVEERGGSIIARSELAKLLVSRISDDATPLQERLGYGVAYSIEMLRHARGEEVALIDRSCIGTYAYQCYHDGADSEPLVHFLKSGDFGQRVVSLLFKCDYGVARDRVLARGAHSKFGSATRQEYETLNQGLIRGQNLLQAYVGSSNYSIDSSGDLTDTVKQMYYAISRHL